MRRLAALADMFFTLGGLPAPASAKMPPMKVIGTDPKFDAIPGFDLTRLSVGSWSGVLGIKFDVNGMLPLGRADASLPAVEWVFTTGNGTFSAQGSLHEGRPRFRLVERRSDGIARRRVRGAYDLQNSYVMIIFPLELIGAARGTTLRGVAKGGGDARASVRVGNMYSVDTLRSTKTFAVP